MNIDLALENNNHLSLKNNLHSFVTGESAKNGSMNCYHYDCSLGKWLYSTGISTYKSIPEIHQLERIHAEMHYRVNDLMLESKKGRTEKSIEAYRKIEEITRQLSDLLKLVKEKIENLTDYGMPKDIQVMCEPSENFYRSLKDINQELVKEHETLFEFFMQAPGLFCILKGPDHVFKLVNPYYKHIIGDRELQGRPVREALPELEGQGVFELLDKVYHRQKAFTGLEIPIYFDKGKGIPERSYVNFIYKPILNPKNETDGILLFGYDVSEQVNLRKQSEESGARLSLAMDASEMGSFEWNMNTKEFIHSELLAKIFTGRRKRKLTHKEFVDLIHPEDKGIRVHAIEDALRTGYMFYEARIIRPDGHLRWIKFNGRIVFDKKKNPRKMYGTALDVTDHKTLEERLERKVKERTKEMILKNELLIQQKELSDSVINASLDNIVVLDTKLRFVKLNAQALKAYRKKEEDLIGQQIHKVFPQLLNSDFYRDLKKAINGESTRDTNYRWAILKGYFEISILPLRDSNDEVYGVLTVAHDNTSIVDASQRLVSAIKKLEDKNAVLEKNNRELESFRYIANHDLQEPLRKIQVFSGLIKKNINNENKVLEYVDNIAHSSRSMSDLIRAVLSFSRLSKNEDKYTEVDLNSIMEDVIADLHSLIEHKRANIRYANLLTATGNYDQLKQLFSCVISNSLKFADKRPMISVSSKIILTKAENQPSISKVNKYLEIIFKDNGIGFEQKYSEQIFKMFRRLQTSKMYPGAGIGLAIVRKIVENHKGHIFVKSEPHKGTTLYIYLPVPEH